MPEAFLELPVSDRREALNIAASETGRPANLLEKDVWVVQALDVLFSSEFGPHLVFKGGTALSKVHRVIERFSEDVDVTYDIRELAPDETAKAMKELDVIPESRSQQSKLSDLIR
jgi:predicted nucleotidyltransferase component of viral defense system